MAKDYGSNMNWAMTRKMRDARLDSDYMSVPGIHKPKTGLHKNCTGCPHIINNTDCKFVLTPKARKWPCYFRVNTKVEE